MFFSSRKMSLVVILAFLMLCFVFADSAQAAWYNSNWDYRVKITIDADKVNGDLTNFPVYVDLSDLDGISGFFENVKSDGSDIRVTKSDGMTEVAREIVAISTTSNTGEMHFVANGTLSGSSNSDWYLYYGNSGASEPAASATYGKNNTWIEDFVAVWHLSESVASASNVYDSTSNDNNGTTQGFMTSDDSITGKVGKAFDFDGINDYVTVPDATSLNFGNGLTISTWIYSIDATPSAQTGILSKTAIGSGFEFNLNIEVNGKISYWNSTDGTTTQGSVNSSSATTDNTWHQVASVYNNSNYLIYLDSTAGSTNAASGDIFNGTEPLNIGRYPSSGWYFDGPIDEVRIANTARSASWISTEYQNQNSPSTFYNLGSQEVYVDTTDPLVTSFSPADNGTGVSISANLVINFDDIIDIQTGNLNIHYANGDLFEEIDVTSGQVTGNGTTTITINPSSNFEAGVGYYVLIDATAFDDDASNNYAGIASATTWNFTTFGMTCDGILSHNGMTIDADLDAYEIQTADIDGDGDTDIVAADFAANDLIWYKNNGSESFVAVPIDTSSTNIKFAYPADIDGDGDMDIVTINFSSPTDYRAVYWYENDGSESFTKNTLTPVQINGLQYLKIVDLDEDGDLDMIGGTNYYDLLKWYENDGSGSFTQRDIDNSFGDSYALDVADVDGDGDLDLVTGISNINDLVWYENDGSESFTRNLINGEISDIRYLKLTDLDQDGDWDILASSYGADDLLWFENNGSEVFTTNTIDSNLADPSSFDLGDIDGDGDLDVVATGITADDVTLYYNDGAQNFTSDLITAYLAGASCFKCL